MQIIVILMVMFFLGFLSAIPTGAVQLEVIKRALHGRIRSSVSVIGGAFTADFFYGFVAFWGILPFLGNNAVMGIFELVSALILSVLSFITIRNRNQLHFDGVHHFIMKNEKASYLLGLFLALANPVMIFWWLLCGNILTDLGLYVSSNRMYAVLTILAGVLGLSAYLSLLMLFVKWARKFISHKILARINLSLGMLLAGLAAYFLFTAVDKLFLG